MIHFSKKEDCCGCSACFNICSHQAINMQTDEQGLIYPIFDINKCVECGLCEKVCPIINSEKRNDSYHNIYAVRIKNKDVLNRSSSGGAFYAIASYVIETLKGVVFGVEYGDDMHVEHSFTESIDGLKKFHGSKYVQSDNCNTFKQVKKFLKEKRYVFFTGTPCQVMSLKLFLLKDYSNLITMDIVCHSVASPLVFKQYVNLVQKKHKDKLLAIDMRNKSRGWSHAFYFYYHFSRHNIGEEKLKCVSWSRLFFSGLITRPSCNQCRFTNFRRTGDITVSDFWDDKSKRPDVYSLEGTSLFITNTPKGDDIFSSIKNNIFYWKLTEDEASQPCLKYPIAANIMRNVFWEYYEKYGFEKAYDKFFKDSIIVKIKTFIKRILVFFHLYAVLKKWIRK